MFVPTYAKLFAKKDETKVSGVYLSNQSPTQATVVHKKVKGKIQLQVSALVSDSDDKTSRLHNFVNRSSSDWAITIQFLVQEGILDEEALDLIQASKGDIRPLFFIVEKLFVTAYD